MTLIINNRYDMGGVAYIPRSHITKYKNTSYAVMEVITPNEYGLTFRHVTMSTKEIKNAFGMGKNERLDII